MTPKRSRRNRGSGAASRLMLCRVRRRDGGVIPLAPTMVSAERLLQRLVERHLLGFLGVQYLASEYTIGRQPRGRIDTLGLDTCGAPVIVEYKRAVSGNLVNQGLFYLDWLDDHRAEFRLLVEERLDSAAAKAIDWPAARLICVASAFSRYDLCAVRQIPRAIDLVRYHWFGRSLLLLERVSVPHS